MEDDYTILGVSRSASHDEIHKAWRKLSYANGRIPSDADPAIRRLSEDRLKEINIAHDSICDHARRSRPGSASSTKSSSSARPGSGTSSGYSTGSSGKSSSSSGDSEKKREEPKSPPPKPPKVYSPVIRSSAYDIALEATQGDIATITFQVFHEGGELPPKWKLNITMNGVLLQDTDVSYYPKDSLPTTVSARIHIPQDTGELSGEISFILDEVK